MTAPEGRAGERSHPGGSSRSPAHAPAARRDRPHSGPKGHQLAGSLPALVSGFLGRDSELETLSKLLARSRLVTLTGPSGIGKSRLAVELARELAPAHPGGGWLVELASVTEDSLVPGAVASALSVPEAPRQALTETLATRLRDRHLLLVLDNCEHLVAATATLADTLLRSCPGLSILATNQESLQIDGETVSEVAELSLPDATEALAPEAALRSEAVRLFVERASSVQPGFALDAQTAPMIAEVCRRLDGTPLAIELAAARVGTLTPADIVRRLDDRFSLLTRGSRSVLPRHRTLEAALDWSHSLLPGPERALLRRLSIFVGGFCLEGAEAVCAGGELEPGQVFDLLDRLVARSLVVAETAGGSRRARYRLLETIKAYAGDRLAEAGEEAPLREAHARFYLSLAERAEPELTGAGQEEWFARLEAERANLRSALHRSLSDGRSEWALRLGGALVLFWRVRCHFSEGRDLLAAALAASEGEDIALRARALWGSGFMALMVDDLDRAGPDIERSLALARELGDRQAQARALLLLGNVSQSRDPESAPALLEESAALSREAGDSWCLAHALSVAGFGHCARDEMEIARPLFEECLAVAREADDMQGLRFGLIGLGQVAVCQGDYGSAESVLREAVAVADELGEDYTKAWALQYLGQLATGQGRYAWARALLEDALALGRETGNPAALVPSLVCRARLAHAEDDRARARELYEEALALGRAGAGPPVRALQGIGELAVEEIDPGGGRRLLEEALDLARAGGDKRGAAHTLHVLSELARDEGDAKRAAMLANEALQLQREIGNAPGIAASLELVAGLAAAAGRSEHAARLLGAAQALRDAGGYARAPRRHSRHAADLAIVRDSLSGEQLEAAVAQGARLSIEEAVVYASKGRGRWGRPATGWSSLTDTELHVAELAAEGLTNPEIAERVFLALGTVKDHLSRIFTKLGVGDRRELAREFHRRAREPVETAG
ncbi:MAG: helix-turn-helix transcriptional regulator [Egibacteraceae bacterium]